MLAMFPNINSKSNISNNITMSHNHIKTEFNENFDVSVKVEPCDFENNVQFNKEITEHIENNVKKESETLEHTVNNFLQNNNVLVNQDIEDLYKDHEIKEELVIGPEEIYKIKEELHYETNPDQHIDKKIQNDTEVVILDKVKNRILKKELASCPKTPKQYLKMKIKREKVDVNGSFIYQVVKEELDWNQMEEVEQYLKTEKTENNAASKNNIKDYKIHIVKKEIISDPEDSCKSDDTSHNNNKVIESKDSKGFRCHICFKTFSFAGNLTRHSKVHSDMKPHKCPECDLSFARKDYLLFHLQKHHSYKPKPQFSEPAICNLCKKEFSKKCTRDFHTKHSCPLNKDRIRPVKNKLYICDVCDMVYVYRSSLAAHILRRHSNLSLGPKHECGYCGKKYVKKHNLQCHIQSLHMKIRPYKCRECKEAFTWHSCLAMHERKAHGKVKKKRF